MNNSSSLSSSSAATSMSPTKLTHPHDKNKNENENTVGDSVITINEKIHLTKQQHHVLKIIYDTYKMSVSEYMQQALVDAMRFDIEEGNFSDALLEKIGGEDIKKDNNSTSPSASLASGLTNNDLDLLKVAYTDVIVT